MGFAVIQVILFILLQIPLGAGAVSQCGEHHLYLVVSAFERHELLQRKGVLDVPITHRDIVQTLRKEDFQIPCQRDTAFKQTEKAGYIYRTGNKAPQNTAGGPRNIWAMTREGLEFLQEFAMSEDFPWGNFMLSDQGHAYPTCLIDAVAKSVYWQGSWMLSWMNLRSTNFNHNNIKFLMEQPPTEPKNLVQFGFRFSDFKERVMTYRAVSSGGENVFLEITLEVRPFEIIEEDFELMPNSSSKPRKPSFFKNSQCQKIFLGATSCFPTKAMPTLHA